MLLLSLIPLAIVSALTINSLFTRLNEFSQRLQQVETSLREDVVGRNLAAAAADTATEIDTYLLERIGDIRRWSEESILIRAAQQGNQQAVTLGLTAQAADETAIENALQGSFFIPIEEQTFSESVTFLFRQIEVQPIFSEILVTNAYGINVLVTRSTANLTHSTTDWWQQASAANQAGIGITPVFLDNLTNRPTIGIALPIFDPNSKEFLGVIRALLDLTELQQRVSRKASSSAAEIRVYNAEGFLLMDTATAHDPATILLPQSSLVSQVYPPAELALAALPGPENAGFTRYIAASPMDTASFIVGYAHGADSTFYDDPAQLVDFPGFGWGITVAQPEQTALQVLQPLIQTGKDFSALPQTLTNLFIFVSLSAAVISLIVALLFATSITRPLIELSQIAGRVQSGDLSVQVQTTGSRDEVGTLARTFDTMIKGLRERERERDIFGRVVSPEVREKLLTGALQLGGETRWVAVLFSDIRGFSTLSEQMTPQEVVAFLNEYLTEMTAAIRPWNGYINNFIGDAIVAIFGAPVEQPDKAWRAVAAALEMRRRLEALNQKRIARGEVPIYSGIGISAGEVVAGQIGSLERLLYTVIGDAVNVAARLETLTKDYPDYPILINGEAAHELAAHPEIHLHPLGPITVKGRSEPVEVFAVND